MTEAHGTTRPRGVTPHSRQLVVAMCALVVTDLVGGLLAIALPARRAVEILR